MIYKLQRRLYADNSDQQLEQSQAKQSPKSERPHKKYTVMENEKKYLSDLEEIGGDTAGKDVNGKRITKDSARHEYETRRDNIKEIKRQKRRIERLERRDAMKEKLNKAKGKAKEWAKGNKKGLIIGGSVLAAGTGATIIGSKIHKKNKQKKIKESVRGYSDVED